MVNSAYDLQIGNVPVSERGPLSLIPSRRRSRAQCLKKEIRVRSNANARGSVSLQIAMATQTICK